MSRTKRIVIEIEKPKERLANRPNGGTNTHKDKRRKTRQKQKEEWKDV